MSSLKYSNKRSLSESSADELISKFFEKIGTESRNQKMWRNELVVNPNSSNKQPMTYNKEETSKNNLSASNVIDIAIRVFLWILFFKLETTTAFVRKIQLEEMFQYKNPRSADYVSPQAIFLSVIFGPLFITLLHLFMTNNRRDFRAASWTWTLVLCLNGLATSLFKITYGRPRPDFFYRCFPDGVMVLNNNTGLIDDGTLELFNCTGIASVINEGRKSFPSGHSSFAFAGFGFITYYIAAKLHAFSGPGRGQTWRLCISITPLVLAALVAVSRTCDYHHHWQDVLAGSLIGLFVSYGVYRQYYPSIFDANCDRPYVRSSNCNDLKFFTNHGKIVREKIITTTTMTNGNCKINEDEDENEREREPLICNVKGDTKWT